MIQTNDITRPPREWVEALQHIGAATVASTLNRMGIRSAFICGPVSRNPGRAVAGPALTLQFMPKREDLYGADEYAQPELQLHRHVLYHTQPGDIVVVDDDGAVVVPVKLAPQVIEEGSKHHEWEIFSKIRLMEGGDLRRYYPLSDAARPEYEEWLKAQTKDGERK
jgi:regulator of RNase E activity RraA